MLGIAILAAFAGCNPSIPELYTDDATPADFGELRISETVNEPELQRHLTAMKSEKATPMQLSERYLQQTDATTAESAFSFFDGTSRSKVENAIAESDHWWDDRNPTRDLLVSTSGIGFLNDWDVKRQAGRGLLVNPKIRFPIDPQQGYLADVSWAETIQCLARAELLHAAKVADESMEASMTSVAYAMVYADQLNQVPYLSVRHVAIQIRLEVYKTLESLFRHPNFGRRELEITGTIFNQSARGWPEEKRLWETDRACGVHFFEMIRAGHFASLLSREEYDELNSENKLATVVRDITRNLTTDQAFYLEAMAKVIVAAQKPYYERAEVLNEISAAMDQARGTQRFPRISADFLLDDLHPQSASLAKDRSQFLAWNLAVQAALGVPQQVVNCPFSGKAIQLVDQPNQVIVRLDHLPGRMPPIEIPKFANR